MSQSYKIKANDHFEFEIESGDIHKLDAIAISSKAFHVLQDNNSFNVELLDSNYNKKLYKVKVNNNTYKINIFNDLDVLIKKMGFENGAMKKVNEIKAPMPGLILDINVKVGQEVLEDDALLILEAMKMENVLTSPRAGIIKSISVNKGDAVDKNQLLIAFEE